MPVKFAFFINGLDRVFRAVNNHSAEVRMHHPHQPHAKAEPHPRFLVDFSNAAVEALYLNHVIGRDLGVAGDSLIEGELLKRGVGNLRLACRVGIALQLISRADCSSTQLVLVQELAEFTTELGDEHPLSIPPG